MLRNVSYALSFSGALLVAGCRKEPGAGPAAPVGKSAAVPVAKPIQREVVDYVEYTGRTDAVQSVGIRARVTGYLVDIPFQEGKEIKKGDRLFEIDPRPYKAQLDQAKGQVRVAEAQASLAKAYFNRAKALVGTNAVSPQEFDTAKAALEEADAQVEAAKATAEAVKLNLDFTKGVSPIDGEVGRYFYTPGNLINQDQTLLTTVVSVDPMYAYFDVDERTVLRRRIAINTGKLSVPKDGRGQKIRMALEGETGYPHEGAVDFANNVVNPSTATLAVRGIFANPKPASGRRLLSPGMFVRVRLPISDPHPALLVIDRAVGSDQGLKFVYVLDVAGKVQYRRVETGPLQEDGLRVIDSGIKPDDWVVVGALQQLRPGLAVEPERVKMPFPGAPAEPVAPADPGAEKQAKNGARPAPESSSKALNASPRSAPKTGATPNAPPAVN
ncbi:MAG TPA: efflux RND transporter periplasmic adaptor subunit [Planctomycetia bacterium]|nr:efflux RND transporter periplasmic adaptor subunit [Planctomycetia bacterium]